MNHKNTRKSIQRGSVGIIVAILAVIFIGGAIYYKTLVSAPKEEAEQAVISVPVENNIPAQETETAAKAGTYEPYAPEKIAKAETGKVVLFFHALWCSTCSILDGDLESHRNAIPENVTILDVDYDNSSDLKQKYKVTTQHTLVQVDAKGNQIKQWKGSPTLAALVAELL